MTATPQTITTAEQLEQAGDIGPCELVRGELIMTSPAGGGHGRSAGSLHGHLFLHVHAQRLGGVFAAETGFLLHRNPDTVRAPDVAFVRADRLHLVPESGFIPIPPDLAVEVISPSDTASEVMDKVDQWLEAGTHLVWVVDPRRKVVRVCTAHSAPKVLRADETLGGGDVIPGFALKVGEIFAR